MYLRVAPWVVALFVAVTPCRATQVNIERLRFNPVNRGIGVVAGADFTWRTGNVEHVKFDVTGRLDGEWSGIHVFIVGSGDFGWVDGEPFSNEALLHFRQVFRPERRLQFEVFEQTNYDKARALDRRLLVGAGPRFEVAQSERAQLWIGTAYMTEYERLDLPSGALHPTRGTYHRWSNYLSARFELAEGSVIQWTGYMQPRFDAFDDVRAISEAQLGVRIIGQLSMNMFFLLRYDSDPPDGVVDLDTSLRSGFSFEL
jgi:Protein of unknown function, DUF481